MGTNKGIDSNSHNGDPVELSETNDLYGYYKPVKALAKTLGACSTPFVVGIYGRWGRGKSTYLNSLKAELDRSGGESRGFQHYQYSPWQYHLESFTDVWVSLLSELAGAEGQVAKSLKEVVKRVNLWGLTRSALLVAADFVPGGAAAKGLIEKFPENIVGENAETENAYQQFLKAKEGFQNAVAVHKKNFPDGRLFIYIDDIDRCEPETSVNVLRALQVLCRTPSCVFILGLDRDVIVNNLTRVYQDQTFAKEYLDKVIQLHVELPVLEAIDMQDALLYRQDGSSREGVELFTSWILECMDYNPRKVERFVYLYDYKLNIARSKSLQHYRQTVLFTAWELRWPELSTEIARNRTAVLRALDEMQVASNEKVEQGILEKYQHLRILQKIQSDREFLHMFRRFNAIKLK